MPMVTVEDVPESPFQQPYSLLQLPVAYGIARVNFWDSRQPSGMRYARPICFSAGDRIAIFDVHNEWYWRGSFKDVEGIFPFTCVQVEQFSQGEETWILESLESLNQGVLSRIQRELVKSFRRTFHLATVLGVIIDLPDVKLRLKVEVVCAIYPNLAQLIMVLYSEYRALSHMLRSTNQYYTRPSIEEETSLATLQHMWLTVYKYTAERGPGPGCLPHYWTWTRLLEQLSMCCGNLDIIWPELKTKVMEHRSVDDPFELGTLFDNAEEFVQILSRDLTQLRSMESEYNTRIALQEDKAPQQLSNTPFYGLSHTDTLSLEAGAKRNHQPFLQRLQATLYSIKNRWDVSLRRLGEPNEAMITVVFLAAVGAVTTAVAAWKCETPDEFPTLDSNFYSTIGSSIIGAAGLFCTIIPILRGTEVQVEDINLFRRLLWASLLLAIAAAFVYMYHTRTSLILLYLSSAAQLATTLQIINGAVNQIKVGLEEIEFLETELQQARQG